MSDPEKTTWSVRMPSSASAFQVQLAGVDAQRVANLAPEQVQTFWNPWTCPEALLPYLAWSLSVDVWNDAWPVNRKRRVVANAPYIHSIKGTRRAIEMALDDIDAQAFITEWFEETPRGVPGTFRVDVLYEHENPQDFNEARSEVRQMVLRTKPKSRTVAISHKIISLTRAKVGSFSRHRATVQLFHRMAPPVLAQTALRVAGVLRTLHKTSLR